MKNEWVALTSGLVRIMRRGYNYETNTNVLYSILYGIGEKGIDISHDKIEKGNVNKFDLTNDFIFIVDNIDDIEMSDKIAKDFLIEDRMEINGSTIHFEDVSIFESIVEWDCNTKQGYRMGIDIKDITCHEHLIGLNTEVMSQPILIEDWLVDTCDEFTFEYDHRDCQFKKYIV